MKENKKNLLPYLFCIGIIFLIPLVYFIKPISEGKKIHQSDIVNHLGVSKEIVDYRQAYKKEPLWTNRVFSGMPAYLISTKYNANKIRIFHRIFTLFDFTPVSFVFLYLLGFLIALWLFGVDPWLSLAGSIAYAFSSYFFIILEVGHLSKVMALGYMPPIIAGVYATYRGKHLIGSSIFALFLALQLFINHLQITYYTMIIILIYMIFKLATSVKEKTFYSLIKPSIFLLLAVILAVGCNFSRLWTTYEYGKYSIRGKSELTYNAEDKTAGLDKSYATQWSYGIDETMTLLIPNFKGGPTYGAFRTNSKTYKLIKRYQGDDEAKQIIKSMPSYWGKQPWTSGPVYVGAAVFFLFTLGLFIVKGHIKWWLLTATIVSIILSWGNNISGFTNLLLDYLPGYNKFRTVSMALVIAEFSMPLMGILALKEIFNGSINKKELNNSIMYSLIITGGLCILFIILSGLLFNFSAAADERYISTNQQVLVNLFISDRKGLLISDSFRSLLFIILTAIVLYAYASSKYDIKLGAFFIGAIFLIDMWLINNRYLNSEDFVTKKEYKNIFNPTSADLIIRQLADKESLPDDKAGKYRVLNLTVGLDGILRDSRTCYFHNSLGGYSGAKMRRYQELFDYVLYDDLKDMLLKLRTDMTPEKVNSVLSEQPVLNMLNTRYIIYNNDAPPMVNNSALGNAWFVNDYYLVNDANDEIKALANFNPANQAIIDRRFENHLAGLNISPKARNDTSAFSPVGERSAKIYLTSYKPNQLQYLSAADSEQLAVFSEIYYDKGWNAYIDGKLTPHFRVNYVLRAMRIPPGEHKIEFRFEPKSYFIGEKVSLVSSVLIILLILGSLGNNIHKLIKLR